MTNYLSKVHINGIEAKIKDEAAQNLILDLQNKAKLEKEARENADNELQSNITAEQTARENADNNILLKIANLKIVNVIDYGAKGDGVSDDTIAFKNAINACPIHGTLYIPYGNYVLSDTLHILKPMSIIGNYIGYDNEEKTNNVTTNEYMLTLLTSNKSPVLSVNSIGVRLKGLCIKSTAYGNDTSVIELSLNSVNSNTNVLRDIHFKDLYVIGVEGLTSDSTTNNIIICRNNIITSSFENVRTKFGNYGFLFNSDETSTSVTFMGCWAVNTNLSGYYLNNFIYSSLINCACDTFHYGNYGYEFVKCQNLSVLSCGSENNGINNFYLNTCKNVLLSCSLINYGTNNTGACGGIQVRDSNNITLISCTNFDTESKPNKASVFIANSDVQIIGCNFKTIKDNSETTVTKINGNYRKLKDITLTKNNCNGSTRIFSDISGTYAICDITPTTTSPTITITGIDPSDVIFYGISTKLSLIAKCQNNEITFTGITDLSPFNFMCKISD